MLKKDLELKLIHYMDKDKCNTLILDEVVYTLQKLLNLCKDYDTEEFKEIRHIVGKLIYTQSEIKNQYETNTGAFLKKDNKTQK